MACYTTCCGYLSQMDTPFMQLMGVSRGVLRKIGASKPGRSLSIHRKKRSRSHGLPGNRPCVAQSLVHSAYFSYSSNVHPHIGGAMVQRLARSPFKPESDPSNTALSSRISDLRSIQEVTADARRCSLGAIWVQFVPRIGEHSTRCEKRSAS